ncbi:MAG: Panacea domain-containing protein [Acidimicrobiales bacterium]
MAANIQYDETKFTELLLYVASRMFGDPSYGSVKRNKVLFFSDFFHYARYGTPITGVEYIAQPLGPAPRGLTSVQQRLIENNEAVMLTSHRGTKIQKMLMAQREPDLSKLTATEIAMVEMVIGFLHDSTGMQASEISHAMLAWKIRTQGDVIPYHSVFLYEGPVTDEEEQLAREIADKLRPELERVAGAA